ncbi:MAG: glycosyltransferase family 4 protein [Chitinophagales bacterium]|nr:glycosyltransferase family 4 protein [Chitinophagales bacterium]
MKKKVFQSLYSGTGGHASVIFNLMENGGLEKWDNYLYFYGVENLEKGHRDFCNKNGIQFQSGVKKYRFDVPGYWKIFKYLLKVKPDVLLIHNPTIIIPVLVYCFLFRSKLITVDHIPNNYKRKAELIMLKMMAFFSDKVVVLSEQHKEELLNISLLFKKQKSKIRVIPNGISYLKDVKRTYVKDRIGMIARFSRQKDQQNLLRATASILKTGKKIQLYLIGSGETFDECKTLAKDLQIEENVIFTGNLKNDEAMKLCASFQLFVMSTHGETVGMTVLEAFSQRVPVLASEVEGIVEYMQEGINGFLVPENHPELMAKRIIELLEKDDDYFEPMIANGLKTIDKRFNAGKTFEAYHVLLS